MDGFAQISLEERADFCRLLPLVFSDYRPWRAPLSMLYIVSETPDNMASGILRAIQLVNGGETECLGVSNGPLGHGYAGFDDTMRRLKSHGWKNQLHVASLDVEGSFNTRTEMEALMRWAGEHIGDIGIVAPAFHLLRAFMTCVTVVGSGRQRVYAYTGAPTDWREQVVHSQGTLVKIRRDLLEEEFVRLKRYQAEEFGGMITPQVALRYLERRDG